MALIKCPECNREISDKASACPQCGCPQPSAPYAVRNAPQPRAQNVVIATAVEVIPTKLRRPWLLYGMCLVGYAFFGIFVVLTLNAIGIGDDRLQPLIGFIMIALVFPAIPLVLFGFVDKYMLRRNVPVLSHPKLAWSAGLLFCLGLITFAIVLVIIGSRRVSQPSMNGQTFSRPDDVFICQVTKPWLK